jgi:hypothetical protein
LLNSRQGIALAPSLFAIKDAASVTGDVIAASHATPAPHAKPLRGCGLSSEA